jgi:glucokinase
VAITGGDRSGMRASEMDHSMPGARSIKSTTTVLAADIGGTHSRFAVFECNGSGDVYIVATEWLQTLGAPCFAQLVDQLAKSDLAKWLSRCTSVVVAVPGPVHKGKALNLPNVPWQIDVEQLQKCFPQSIKTNVYLINDFVAHAMACLTPAMVDRICIQPGQEDPSGNVATIGAGTGIGFCSLVLDMNQKPVVVPSEAGHQRFPFCSSEDRCYEDFLIRETGRNAIDSNTVVSGLGLALLHQHLTGSRLSPQDVETRLTADSELARRFATYYGRAAQNYALAVLPTGGLYLTGGVAARNPFLVDHDAFRAEFSACRYHEALLKRIPIFLNANQESGLWGAASYAAFMSAQRTTMDPDSAVELSVVH